MSFDATDLEIARRQHNYEMGGETASGLRWSRWHKQATAAVVSAGWETPVTRGLDGAEDEDGFSLDFAYDAWERGLTVAAYMGKVKAARERLGL